MRARRAARADGRDRHSDMAVRKSQPLVEVLRVDAGVRRARSSTSLQPLARASLTGPMQEFFADA